MKLVISSMSLMTEKICFFFIYEWENQQREIKIRRKRNCETKNTSLSYITISILLSLLTLEILLLDENVNALFDDLNFWFKSRWELIQDLRHQLRVIEHFSHLHNAYNGCLNEHLTIFFDVLVCHLLFCLLFRFQWEVDVDAEFLTIGINFN